MKDHSQYGEQQYIVDFFKDAPGRFIDFGAFDGVSLSNTYALAERAWHGVCVEADPVNFVSLMKNYQGNSQVELVCAAIAHANDLIPFYRASDGTVSSACKAHADKWSSHADFTKIFLPSISFTEIINRFGNYFDFINIDVEGNTVDLFKELISLIDFKLICVEHDGRKEDCGMIAEKYNLKIVFENDVNIIYAK